MFLMHWITPYTEMYQSIIMQHFPHISLLTSTTTQPKLPSHEKPPWYQKCHFIYVLWLHVAANIKAYSRVNNYIPLFSLYSYYKLLWHQPVDAIDVGKELRRDVLSHFIVPEKKYLWDTMNTEWMQGSCLKSANIISAAAFWWKI